MYSTACSSARSSRLATANGMQGETGALPPFRSPFSLPALSSKKSSTPEISEDKKPFEPSWQKESTRSSALHFRPPLKVLVTIALDVQCFKSSPRQRLAKGGAPGWVNFITAVAYYFCLNLPAAFTQPGASTFADLYTCFE